MAEIAALFTAKFTMQFLLGLLVFIVLLTLVKMTRNSDDKFDLRDLVSIDGKLDEKKFTRFGAWVVSTWGFVYLLVSDTEKLSEWYFIGYMGAWVANVIMDKYMNPKPTLNTKPIEDPPRNTRND